MSLDPISSIADLAKTVVSTIWPDPAKKAEADVRIEEMKQNGELQILANQLESKKADLADTASARQRESDVAKATGKRDDVPAILALSLTAGFFGLLTLLVFVEVPESTKQILFIMVGSLSTSFAAVIGYYFGSSSSSRKKDEILALIKNK